MEKFFGKYYLYFYDRLKKSRQNGEKLNMEQNIFENGSVPVAVAARVYHKDPAWVRAGIIVGWLPIGIATRNNEVIRSIDEMDSKKGRINYYISPLKLYQETGYVWKGERE